MFRRHTNALNFKQCSWWEIVLLGQTWPTRGSQWIIRHSQHRYLGKVLANNWNSPLAVYEVLLWCACHQPAWKLVWSSHSQSEDRETTSCSQQLRYNQCTLADSHGTKKPARHKQQSINFIVTTAGANFAGDGSFRSPFPTRDGQVEMQTNDEYTSTPRSYHNRSRKFD